MSGLLLQVRILMDGSRWGWVRGCGWMKFVWMYGCVCAGFREDWRNHTNFDCAHLIPFPHPLTIL